MEILVEEHTVSAIGSGGGPLFLALVWTTFPLARQEEPS
jgi:hypothetical protein